MLPMDRSKTYVLRNGIVRSIPNIKKMVEDYHPTMGRVPIGCVRYDDLRATLVLGGGGLTCDERECAVNEDIAYSENAPKTFWIDEAIFSVRQDLGWFHPYWLEYRWARGWVMVDYIFWTGVEILKVSGRRCAIIISNVRQTLQL